MQKRFYTAISGSCERGPGTDQKKRLEQEIHPLFWKLASLILTAFLD